MLLQELQKSEARQKSNPASHMMLFDVEGAEGKLPDSVSLEDCSTPRQVLPSIVTNTSLLSRKCVGLVLKAVWDDSDVASTDKSEWRYLFQVPHVGTSRGAADHRSQDHHLKGSNQEPLRTGPMRYSESGSDEVARYSPPQAANVHVDGRPPPAGPSSHPHPDTRQLCSTNTPNPRLPSPTPAIGKPPKSSPPPSHSGQSSIPLILPPPPVGQQPTSRHQLPPGYQPAPTQLPPGYQPAPTHPPPGYQLPPNLPPHPASQQLPAGTHPTTSYSNPSQQSTDHGSYQHVSDFQSHFWCHWHNRRDSSLDGGGPLCKQNEGQSWHGSSEAEPVEQLREQRRSSTEELLLLNRQLFCGSGTGQSSYSAAYMGAVPPAAPMALAPAAPMAAAPPAAPVVAPAVTMGGSRKSTCSKTLCCQKSRTSSTGGASTSSCASRSDQGSSKNLNETGPVAVGPIILLSVADKWHKIRGDVMTGVRLFWGGRQVV
eukprot:gene10141-8042_t